MKIGLLSDIHSNLPALESVLQDMPDVDEIVCAGDVVGYNPMPSQCLTRIRGIVSETVQGNHDRTVETPEHYRINEMAYAGLKHAQAELSDEQRQWLQALPETTEFGDGDYLLVHSHPKNRDEYVYPQGFPELRAYLDDYSGIVLGHTHIQHSAKIDDRVIVNPGSVGQPRDGDPRAAYAILDTEANNVDLHRVPYNIDRIHHEVVINDLPTETGERLFDGE